VNVDNNLPYTVNNGFQPISSKPIAVKASSWSGTGREIPAYILNQLLVTDNQCHSQYFGVSYLPI
jgi:hypothetical protein